MKFTGFKYQFTLIAAFNLLIFSSFSQTSQYNITAYGAVKNSAKVCTKEVQAAIDACNANGGGDVVVPQGIFTIGTIHLKSNVDLYLASGGVLRGSANLNDYELAAPEKGFQQVRKGMLFTENAENVSITGQGKIDGNGDVFFDTTTAKRLEVLMERKCGKQ